ncbi:MAG: aminopeptidase P N-terminal domain-containing protein [Planctomycetota bacterium]|jgi:Xaa-Pro aminopeptidase
MFRQRRQKLLDKLGDGLLFLPTAPQTLRNGDVHHEFRPGSDLHYLTGFPEPRAVLMAWRTGRDKHKSVLFVMPRNKEREIWDGPRHGVKGAVKQFGVDEAHPIGDLWEQFPKLLGEHQRLFYTLGDDTKRDQRLLQELKKIAFEKRRSNAPAHPTVADPRPTVAAMRLIKDAHELELMQEAARITVAGHLRAMRFAKPGLTEYQVQAELEAEFRRQGSPRNGYPSIVASGSNACILHYVQNDRRMRRGELLLLDAGAEYEQYTADITRTYPVDGTFTPAQKAVYAAVLTAQKAGIRAVKPGAAWDAPHKACLRSLTRSLMAMRLLRGRDLGKLIKKGACRKWFMHGTSHWLGMDVHDVGPYQDADGKPERLRSGMVLTIEPGLYFDRRDKSVPKEYRGIGVRIEDDVLVTRGGHRVLTAAMPKEIREVERACSGEASGEASGAAGAAQG